MTIKKALAFIRDNWIDLKKKQDALDKNPYGDIPNDCVWFVSSDTAGSYETDLELIGMQANGSLVWAYASGCSCWSGEYEIHQTHDPLEFKAFAFNHEGMSAAWERKTIAFAEKATGEIEDATSAQPA